MNASEVLHAKGIRDVGLIANPSSDEIVTLGWIDLLRGADLANLSAAAMVPRGVMRTTILMLTRQDW